VTYQELLQLMREIDRTHAHLIDISMRVGEAMDELDRISGSIWNRSEEVRPSDASTIS